MIQPEELYDKLNLSLFKTIIFKWIRGYSPISKVTLYQTVKYLSIPCYVLVAEVPPFPEKKTKGQSKLRQRYREEKEKSPPKEEPYPFDFYPPDLYPHDLEYTDDEEAVMKVYNSKLDCVHLWDWLPDIYKDDTPYNYRDEWMWINISPGEELDDQFVWEDSRYVLYGDSDKVSEDIMNSKGTISVPDISPQNIDDFIKKRESQGVHPGLIASELHDKKGPFHLTYYQIGIALGMDEGLNNTQRAALKMRVIRLIKKYHRLIGKD